MFTENDRDAEFRDREADVQPIDSSDVAQRRLTEFKEGTLKCEHADSEVVEAAAIDRSARIIERWEETSDPATRKYMLERVGREMMVIHEAPPAPIHEKAMPRDHLGAYVDADFRTDVNSWQLERDNPKDALETYLHEYRHAEQHYEVQKSHGIGSGTVDLERSLAVEHSLNDYVDATENPDGYRTQLAEVDAEGFGTSTAAKILERRDEIRAESLDAGVASDADRAATMRLAAARRTT